MNNTDKTKPQADDKGLQILLGFTQQATDDIIANHRSLSILKQINKGSGLYQDAGYLTVENDEKIGEKIDTTDKVIVTLLDNSFNPASLAIFNPKGNAQPELTEPSQPYALVIGDPFAALDIYAAKTLDEGIALYQELAITQGLNIAVLVSLNEWHFNSMIKYYAQNKTITVTATLDNKKQLIEPLKGVNAKAVITQLIPLHDIINQHTETYDSVMATAEVIELEPLDWLQPERLSIDPSTPTPYPIQAWQGLLKNVVIKIAYHAQVPEAMAGQCVLGALAHMGQRFIDAPMEHAYKPASLILITEGESGSGKTQSIGLSHKEIYKHEMELYKQYDDDLALWEANKANLKQDEYKTFLVNEPKLLNSSSIFKAPTIEPILDKFVNKELINASWTTDDAAQFFNGYTMTSKTSASALADITDLYSGGEVERERSQKNAYANPRNKAYGVRFTLMLMAQRVILEPALSNALLNGQGFLARAMIACPEDLRGHRVWNDPERREQSADADPDLKAYWNRCKELLDPSLINDPDVNEKGRIKMGWHDDQAEQTFYDHMQVVEDRMKRGKQYEFTKAYASRMAENASRIASLMAFFEGRYTITTDDIKRGYMLVEYSTSERLRYLDATPTNDECDTQKLSKWLIDKARNKKPHKLNRTYVSNGAPNPMRKNSKLLQAELDKLESAGHIRQDLEGRKNIILVNPRLYS